MKKNKTTKRALLSSVIALMICLAMLMGTTYAWFTDSAASSGNVIKSGTLNIDLLVKGGETGYTDYTSIKASSAPVFNYQLWEPGYTDWANVKVTTTGNLALKYTMRIVANGTVSELGNVIDVYYAPTEIAKPATRPADLTALGLTRLGTISEVIGGTITVNDTLIPGTNAEDFGTIVLHMQESAGNEYQNKELGTNFSIQLLATQYTFESDSFGIDYDELADGTPDNANFPVEATSGSYDPLGGIVLSTEKAKVTVPAGAEDEDGAPLDTSDTLKLTVEPGTPDSSLSVTTLEGTTTYEVTLKNQDGKKITSSDPMKVELNVGFVDLQAFYHNTTALTPVTDTNSDGVVNAEDVTAVNTFFYDATSGIVTFMTDSFSPFTAEYLFDGGIGTEAHPYVVKGYDQLTMLDQEGIEARYPAGGTDKIYYVLEEDVDVASATTDEWAHTFLYADTRTFAVDMGGKTIALGEKYLFGYATNLEMYNGTFTFSGAGTSVVDYACYMENVDSYSINFHDLVLNGTITNNGNAHYGPLVSYAFGINGTAAVSEFKADNITNNLIISSNNSNGYVGGLFGYVQGTGVSAAVTNCTFNGSVSGTYAAAFVNGCSFPKAGMTSSGNVLNGTVLGSKGAQAFGCNSNITGGSTALTALNNSVTLGAEATISTVAPSTDLITVDGNKQVNFKDVEGAASYRAAIVFSVGQGFPRYITKDITDSDAETYESGIYQYNVVNETADGSASGSVIQNSNGTVIWEADGAYHFFSEEYDITGKNATVAVYAYNAGGSIIAYQTISYALN